MFFFVVVVVVVENAAFFLTTSIAIEFFFAAAGVYYTAKQERKLSRPCFGFGGVVSSKSFCYSRLFACSFFWRKKRNEFLRSFEVTV
jgi:hypothetical protein